MAKKPYKEVPWLDEKKLGDYLGKIFPDVRDWLHNKAFKPYRFLPDYQSKELKIVVEFDGFMHYTDLGNILRDEEKDSNIQKAGYRIVRIPYFVQLSSATIPILFGVERQFQQVYPHGFISTEDTMKFPAAFCGLGVEKFQKDLDRFDPIKNEIVKSLKDKMGVMPVPGPP